MSKTSIILLTKLGMIFISAWITFGYIDDNTIGLIFLVSLIGTILNYILGDLFVLPALGNIVASLWDGLMGWLVVYLYAIIIPTFTVSWTSLAIFSLLVAIVEYFFHVYLVKSEKVAP
ncbi:DUF2512 family protein [Alkaliphilus transvaalensis]|uniref:DUF2512 family protein n=1 Tax=Alkaliphilus transvaalensis TaxID=114628 RepID=UPI000478BB65|nr:DUF2512 family protein [Alkaliphilus transvaalensis]